MAITIVVTTAGRAALVNAQNTGTNAVTVTQLGVTETAFVPVTGLVALPGEIKRIASVAGVVVADDAIHITASDVTPAAYTMRGFGLYLNDGTLFATYGQAGPILNKTSESMMLLALDIGFADIDAEMIEFGDTNFILPLATTEIAGLVELATTAEAQTGSDATRVLTAMTGKQSVLGWLLSQDGSGSGLDADLLDGLHASAFSLAGHNHNINALNGYGTMASQNHNAVNITGGAIGGTEINGATVGLVTAAAGRFSTLTATANVGIGAPVPMAPLHITSGADKHILFKNAAHDSWGNLTCAITFGRPDGAVDLAAMVGWNNGGLALAGRSGLAFATGGAASYSATTERMRIASNGNVGIGTNDPSAVLEISGVTPNIRVTTLNYDAAYGFEIVSGGQIEAAFKAKGNTGELSISSGRAVGWGGSIRFLTDTSEKARLTSDGRFGIGTQDPSVRLSLGGTTGRKLAIYDLGGTMSGFGVDLSGSGNELSIFSGYNGGNGNISFGGYNTGTNAYTERMRIAANGSVTIAGSTAWHAGNDGSGSGLDADLLDGQHGAYYLPAASYTATDILAKLAGVDGAGSGLDADLLDGLNSSAFLQLVNFVGTEVLSRLVTVDGSGSGLDADLLDGYHASSFDRVVEQNLTAEGGYIVYASGRKECWGTVVIGMDSYATWNLPVAHTSWCHPSFTYTGKAGVNNTADNTMFVGFLGAPPYATRWYNAEDATLTIYVRTIGV